MVEISSLLKLNEPKCQPSIEEKIQEHFGFLNDVKTNSEIAPRLFHAFKQWSNTYQDDELDSDVVNGIWNVIKHISSIDIFLMLIELISYKDAYLVSLCVALLNNSINMGLLVDILCYLCKKNGDNLQSRDDEILPDRVVIDKIVVFDRTIISKISSLCDRICPLLHAKKWWKFDNCLYNKLLVDTLFSVINQLETYTFSKLSNGINMYPLILFIETLVKTNKYSILFTTEYYKNLLDTHMESIREIDKPKNHSHNNCVTMLHMTYFHVKLYATILFNVSNIHIQWKIITKIIENYSEKVISKLLIYADIDILNDKSPLKFIFFQKIMFETPLLLENDNTVLKLVTALFNYMKHRYENDVIKNTIISILDEIIIKLSDNNRILQCPNDYVLYQCELLLSWFHCIMQLYKSIDSTYKYDIMPKLMKISSAFLSSQNTSIKRDMGLFVVENIVKKLNIKCDAKLKFSYVDSIFLQKLQKFTKILFNYTHIESNVDKILSEEKYKIENSINELNINDNFELPKKPLNDIYFLRDCIDALLNKEDRDLNEKAINSIEKHIRRSKSETKSVSVSLFKLLLNIQNEFNIKKFDALRVKSMAALIIQDSETISKLAVSMFYQENLSLSQRFDILSAISLAIQELFGRKLDSTPNYTDNNIKYHFLFDELIKSNENIISKVNKPYSLLKASSNKKMVKISKKEMIKLVQIIFYNLFDIEKAKSLKTLRIYHEDSFILAQLLKTLNIIVSCTKNYPTSIELCKELQILTQSLYNHPHHQVRYMAVMSMVTCIDTLCCLPSSLKAFIHSIKSKHFQHILNMSLLDVNDDVRSLAQLCVQLLSVN